MRLRSAIATARLAACCPTTYLSSSATISRGVSSSSAKAWSSAVPGRKIAMVRIPSSLLRVPITDIRRSGGLIRLDIYLRKQFRSGETQIVVILQIEPELRWKIEENTQPQRRVSRNGTLAQNDIVYARCRDGDLLGETVRSQPKRLHEL